MEEDVGAEGEEVGEDVACEIGEAQESHGGNARSHREMETQWPRSWMEGVASIGGWICLIFLLSYSLLRCNREVVEVRGV